MCERKVQAGFLGLELSGLLFSTLARVSHQIFKKKPITKTRIANAPRKRAINRWSAIDCETAPGMTNGVCRIPIAANAKAIHLTFLRPSLFTGLQSFFLVSVFLGQLSHSKYFSSHRSVIGNRRVSENLGEGEVPAAVTGQMPIRNSSCPVTRLTGT